MNKETLRMQMLAGVITEGEYKTKLEEATALMKNASKEAKARDTEESDREYIAHNKKRDKLSKELFNKTYKELSQTQKSRINNKLEENEDKSSLNEGMIGGIVGVGAITQIPPRAKTDYETAFEHFLGERYETKFENREQDPYTMEEDLEEAKMGNIDPAIKNNPAFNKLVSYLKTHPDEAEELKDKEDEIEDVLQNVNEAFKKGGKFYTQDTYGNTKEVDFKTYLKDKGISVAMSAAALGFLGALMAGALGTNTPNEILDAVLVASGIGAAAGATLGEGEEPLKDVSDEKKAEYLVYMTGMSYEDAITAIRRGAKV